MADLGFKEERAKQWMKDVLQEIELVNAELRKVNTECEITPGEEDTILQGLQKCNTEMQNGWNRLCTGFTEATNKVQSAFGRIANTLMGIGKDLENLTTRMK